MNLEHIDLNLLRLMLVLLEEGSVSSAAERLNLSQSAVSKQLTRLRAQLGTVLDDPLFVRTGRGLEPTARAARLEQPLRQWLRLSRSLLSPETFDPAQDAREFRISICETAFPVVIPRILPSLSQLAPQLQLNIVSQSSSSLQQLEQGQLDLLIIARDIDKRAQPPWHVSDLPPHPNQELYRDHHVALVRRDHPQLAQEWDLASFLQIPHVRIWVEDNELWLLDHVLASMGHHRLGTARVPDFHSAALLVQHTDMMLVCTSVFAGQLARRYGLQPLPLPLDMDQVSYRMLWPQMLDQEPAHQWLRDFIQTRCDGLTD